jgi:hypothetical protein
MNMAMNRAERRRQSKAASKMKKPTQFNPSEQNFNPSGKNFTDFGDNLTDIPPNLDMSQLPPDILNQMEALTGTSDPNRITGISVASGGGTKRKAAGGRNYKYEVLKSELMGLYGGAGMLITPFQPSDGVAILQHAESIADAWVTLAKGNESVYKVLKAVCGASAIGTVLALHASLLNTILGNHGVTIASLLKRNQGNDDNTDPNHPLHAVPSGHAA